MSHAALTLNELHASTIFCGQSVNGAQSQGRQTNNIKTNKRQDKTGLTPLHGRAPRDAASARLTYTGAQEVNDKKQCPSVRMIQK